MKDYRDTSLERLIHIQNAVEEIEKFIADKGRDEFLGNDILASAILFKFSVIGEAIIHIEPSIIDKYKYPWL